MDLTAQERARISAAVTQAEARTDGEIVPIFADISDSYRDAALQWSVLAAMLVLGLQASFPEYVPQLVDEALGGWRHEWTARGYFTIAVMSALSGFLLMRVLTRSRPILMALVPSRTKTRRVRRQAVNLFRVGIELRTRSRTGVLLYVSMAEHRAEIVGDRAIVEKVSPEHWAQAMEAMIADLKDGRPADAMIDAIAVIGDILAVHFPRTGLDPDELPDRVIEL